MTCVTLTRSEYNTLPRLHRAVARLMEEEGRIRIVGDENCKEITHEN